jgi:hypothetical protein
MLRLYRIMQVVPFPDAKEKPMDRLIINDELIHQLIKEVSPLVESETTWQVRLDSLEYKVVPRQRGYEEIIYTRIRDLGIPFEEPLVKDPFTRLFEYLVEHSYIAAYLPGSQRIYVVSENVDDSNMDGLRLVVAHELVHRAQHLRYPGVIKQLDRNMLTLLKPYLEAGNPLDIAQVRAVLDEIEPTMILLESHAAFIQNLIGVKYFPQAKIEEHLTLLTVLLQWIYKRQASRYTRGLPAIEAASQSGNIDQLFHNPKSVMNFGL